MPLDPALARLLPHAGAMCLLDAVLDWDARRIACRASSHRDLAHPLRRGGRLGILCGIEYAAQAMALHGALAGGGRRTGYLASLRDLAWTVERLDDRDGPLEIAAECLHAEGARSLYGFSLAEGSALLLRGRAAVALV